MKRVFLIILLLCAFSFAQNSVRIFGGVNAGNMIWNDEDMQDEINPQPILGIDAGIEKPFGNLLLGAHYVQRGMMVEDFMVEGIEATMTMNYVNGFAAFMILPPESFINLFIGAEVGKFLNGEMEISYEDDSESEDIDAEDVDIDYGALAGINIWLTKTIGVRGTYYYGLNDTDKNEDEDYNSKHHGLAVQLSLSF